MFYNMMLINFAILASYTHPFSAALILWHANECLSLNCSSSVVPFLSPPLQVFVQIASMLTITSCCGFAQKKSIWFFKHRSSLSLSGKFALINSITPSATRTISSWLSLKFSIQIPQQGTDLCFFSPVFRVQSCDKHAI